MLTGKLRGEQDGKTHCACNQLVGPFLFHDSGGTPASNLTCPKMVRDMSLFSINGSDLEAYAVVVSGVMYLETDVSG